MGRSHSDGGPHLGGAALQARARAHEGGGLLAPVLRRRAKRFPRENLYHVISSVFGIEEMRFARGVDEGEFRFEACSLESLSFLLL